MIIARVLPKLKKASKKIQKRTIQALLYISEDTFVFSKSPLFNCLKMGLFFLQLQGYIFSEYETKHLLLSENIYYAQYTQLSALTFILLQMQIDILTLVCFYSIFILHLLVYFTLIVMSLKQNIHKPSVMKKLLNLFFVNYQWIFVTPFQEISIGVMICGKNSFLSDSIIYEQCIQKKNKFIYVIGILGTFFVSLSGFAISYFFRNYQFNDRTFSRQYSPINVARIIIHQLIIILYYVNFSNINYFKHTLQHILSVSLIVDLYINQPFGYSFEALFYSCAVYSHQFLIILVSIWIFSENVEDKFIFYTFLIVFPLIIALAISIQKRDQIIVTNNFKLTQFYSKSDIYLEEIFRTAEESDISVEAKIQFIQLIYQHTNTCCLLNCICQKNIKLLVSNNGINNQNLNDLTTQLFEHCLKITLQAQEFSFYEHLSLKYVTFLGQYKNNPINAFVIIQQLMSNQQSNRYQKAKQSSFYFKHIQAILADRNKETFSADQEIMETDHINILLKTQSLILNLGQRLQDNLLDLAYKKYKLWQQFLIGRLSNFDDLFSTVNTILDQVEFCQKHIKFIKYKQNKSKNMQYDSIYFKRLELLYSICAGNDLQYIYELENNIFQIATIEQQSLDLFSNSDFNQELAISIAASILKQNRGELWNPNQGLIRTFFNRDADVQNINELMPRLYSKIHNQIIEHFIQNGKVKQRQTVIDTFFESNGYLQRINFKLSFFFPKYDNSFSYYMIAHVKKILGNTQNDENCGYILLDDQLRINGYDQFVYENLIKQYEQFGNCQTLNFGYILPSLSQSLQIFYEFQQKQQIQPRLTSDVVVNKQIDFIFVGNQKSVSLSDHHRYMKTNQMNFENRLAMLSSIAQKIQTLQGLQVNFKSVQYSVYQNVTHYIENNQRRIFVTYQIQLFLLEDQQSKEKENIEIQKWNRGSVLKISEHSDASDSFQQDRHEHISLRSKSSGLTFLQHSNSLQNIMRKSLKPKQFKGLQLQVLLYFLILLSATFTTLLFIQFKYDAKDYCLDEQSGMINQFTNHHMLIKFISYHLTAQLYNSSSTFPINSTFQFQMDDLNRKKISSELLQSIMIDDNFPHNMQNNEQEIQITYTVNLNIFSQTLKNDKQFYELYYQTRQSLQQLISIDRIYLLDQKILIDLALILQNFWVSKKIFSNVNQVCQDKIAENVNTLNSLFTNIMILFYILGFASSIAEILLINQIFQKRKQYLKLFTRCEPKEIQTEINKYEAISQALKSQCCWIFPTFFDTIFRQYYKRLNDHTQNDRNDQTLITDSRQDPKKMLSAKKQKIEISHKFSQVGTLSCIILQTILLIGYILTFHILLLKNSDLIFDHIMGRRLLLEYNMGIVESFQICDYALYAEYIKSQDFTSQQGKELQFIYENKNLHTLDQINESIQKLQNQNFSFFYLQSTYADQQSEQIQDLYEGNICQQRRDECNEVEKSLPFSELFAEFTHSKGLLQILAQVSQNYIGLNDYLAINEKRDMQEFFKSYINQQGFFIYNIWSAQIIFRQLKLLFEQILGFSNQIIIASQNQTIITALAFGVVILILNGFIWLFFLAQLNFEYMRTKSCLSQLPLTTLMNKSIHQQLKLIQ